MVNKGERTGQQAGAEGGRGVPEAKSPPCLSSLEPRRQWLRRLQELGGGCSVTAGGIYAHCQDTGLHFE